MAIIDDKQVKNEGDGGSTRVPATDENIKKMVEQNKIKEANVDPTHRYYCDACTGTAFLLTEGAPYKSLPTKCGQCGAPIGEYKVENFIKLWTSSIAGLPATIPATAKQTATT